MLRMAGTLPVPEHALVWTSSGLSPADVDRLVGDLFEREGRSRVRMARPFVDDRNAAEDLGPGAAGDAPAVGRVQAAGGRKTVTNVGN